MTPTRPLKKLVFGTLTALAMLLAAEGLLRLVLPVAARATLPNQMLASHLRGETFAYDPDLFWYWPELPVRFTGVNRFGFRREVEMTQDKPAGGLRALTFGDSQTFGAGLPPEEAWPLQAEAALGEPWEVLNAGISGYRTLNIYRLLQLRMAAFEPDYVLIDCMPFDSPRDHGGLVAAGQATPAARLKALLWHSRVYYGLRLALEKANPRRARWLDHAPTMLRGQELGLGNHDLIAAWAEDNGAQAVFLTYAVSEEDFTLGCHTNPGELPEGVPVIDACAALKASGHSGRELFQDRNHFTALGARLVGEEAARVLAALERGEPPI